MSLKIAQDTKIIPGSSGSRFVFSHACKGDARSRRYPDFLNITFLFSTQTLISSYACNIRGARTHHCPHFNEAAFRSDPNTFPVSLAGRVDRLLLAGGAGRLFTQPTHTETPVPPRYGYGRVNARLQPSRRWFSGRRKSRRVTSRAEHRMFTRKLTR